MINIRAVGPKVLIWDIETSSIDLLVRQYDLKSFAGRHDPSKIVRDWVMLGASWKWHGSPHVKSVSVSSKDTANDYEVVSILHTVLDEADILVGHNSDAFDLKKFNTRAIKYGFSPIAPKKSYDTLKIARKYFRFTSNKLRYVADYLGLEAKDESPDWDKCLLGDENELRYMRQYNRQDVITTEQVFDKLRSYHNTGPDLNTIRPMVDVLDKPVHTCPACQSPDLRRDKPKFNKSGKLVGYLYQCLSCERWSQK